MLDFGALFYSHTNLKHLIILTNSPIIMTDWGPMSLVERLSEAGRYSPFQNVPVVLMRVD